jgi:hypothetical protein
MSDELGFDPSNTMPGAPTGGLPAAAAGLPPGAQQFIRGYTPSDDDQGVIGTFELVSEFKPHKSKEQGREVFEDVEYVRINVRGNDKIEVHRPAREEDIRRFPFAYQQFKQGLGGQGRGTALSVIGMDATVVRIFHAKNVFTVEDLALVNDNNLQNLGAGAREWRHKAKGYIEGKAPRPANDAQVGELKAQLAEAIQIMKSQGAEIAELKAKKKPGRKPKPRVETPQAE